MTAAESNRHRVVVLGGGFAGLAAARELARGEVELTLVDRRNHHLFQPLLYQVATGGLSPADIAAPLRHVLRGHRNARVLLAEVTGFDLERRRVLLSDGELPYDSLLVACGSRTAYFGHTAWSEHAPGLKDVEDATRIRSQLLAAFERAEREGDPIRRRELMTFVIVGGGPTGVELAGAIAELARDTLRNEFRSIDPRQAQIHLVEAGERLLETYPPRLSERARQSLAALGVEVRLRTMVTDIGAGRVRLRHEEAEQDLLAETVLWAAGVRASELGTALAQRAGIELDRQGRVPVGPDLSLPGRPEVFVAGDLARALDPHGAPLPGIAPVAMQQGRYVGAAILARLRGASPRPFRYVDRGNMAVIGRSAAVADVRGKEFGGFAAWLLWLFVHLMYLVGFANRVLVFFQWAWNYTTHNRTARLITGEAPPRSPER